MEFTRLIGLGAIATLFASLHSGSLQFRYASNPEGMVFFVMLSPMLLWLWLPSAGLLLWSQLLPRQTLSNQGAAWYRVMLVFVIDAALFLKVIFVPLLALALLLEALHSGSFAWQFSRNFFRPSDNILLPALFGGLALFFGSFGLTFATGRGTPGCLAAGIALTLEPKQSLFDCACEGVLAYLHLAVPPFRFFGKQSTVKPAAWIRAG